MRPNERLLIAYFAYVALISPWFIPPWKPLALAVSAAVMVVLLGRAGAVLRDWAPLALVLTAYREMDWFTPAVHTHRLETSWILWDRWLLDDCGLRAAIESLGALIPGYLELCYAVVYLAGPFGLGVLYALGRRERAPQFLVLYIAGTVLSYGLFPYFPSEPPRTVFAGQDLPHIATVFRRYNLWLLGGYGIHSSVFPSAHVSSALAAAWGLLLALPEKKWIGGAMCVYALSVAVATVYGRYHYAVDALAGIAVACSVGFGLRFKSGASTSARS